MNQSALTKASMKALADDELVSLYHTGSESALEILLTRYISLAEYKASHAKIAGYDYDDVVQDGLMALLSAVKTYRPGQGCSFFTYANVCVQNAVNKAYAKSQTKKYKILSDSMPIDEMKEPSALQCVSPEEILIDREEMLKVKTYIATLLSSTERETLFLHLKGYSYAQIAQVLKTSPKSVDNALQRVRRKLKIEMSRDQSCS